MSNLAKDVLNFELPTPQQGTTPAELFTFTGAYIKNYADLFDREGNWLISRHMVTDEGTVEPVVFPSVKTNQPAPKLVTVGIDLAPNNEANDQSIGWEVSYKRHYFAVYAGVGAFEHTVRYDRDAQARLRLRRPLETAEASWLGDLIQRLVEQPDVVANMQHIRKAKTDLIPEIDRLLAKAETTPLSTKETIHLKTCRDFGLEPLPWTPLRIKQS